MTKMKKMNDHISWDNENCALVLLDQRVLPDEEKYVVCDTVEKIAQSIENMTVRGAPAIGITAAYGVALASFDYRAQRRTGCDLDLNSAFNRLAKTRPTAVNLFTALERMKNRLEHEKCRTGCNPDSLANALLDEAVAIHNEDIENNLKMGAFGAALLPDNAVVLTHCNAGALATGGHGTALGVIRSARDAGKRIKVYADETRPLFQGARLTVWELARDNFDVTLISEGMAGALMSIKKIDAVIVGADRIAKNGDTANKIGTYGLSVLAKAHNVPFYIAAPFSTFDFKAESGKDIPIEERADYEMRVIASPSGDKTFSLKHVPDSVHVWNPAFDVTPCANITAIITEKGVFYPPYKF